MIQTAFVSIVTVSILSLSGLSLPQAPTEQVLASQAMSLDNRQESKGLNDIYKDNILLNLAYLNNTVSGEKEVDWGIVNSFYRYEFILRPNETFAFHEDVLPEYKGRVIKTTNSHFNYQEGYKSDGYLYGMGVCHLASLIHWAAKDAGLDSFAPSNHDFYEIREIPREYGVAIYNHPNNKATSARQNLYITNNLDSEITFRFEYDGVNLKVSVLKNS